MTLIKKLSFCALICIYSFCSNASTEEIIDRKTKLHLYAVIDDGKEISFSLKRYNESSKRFVFEFTNLVADDIEKKWKVGVSNQEPSRDIIKTWDITEREDLLLRTYLTNPGSKLVPNFMNDQLRIRQVSSVSEFLDVILHLSKFVSTTSDDPIIKQPLCSKKVLITSSIALSSIFLLYFNCK